MISINAQNQIIKAAVLLSAGLGVLSFFNDRIGTDSKVLKAASLAFAAIAASMVITRLASKEFQYAYIHNKKVLSDHHLEYIPGFAACFQNPSEEALKVFKDKLLIECSKFSYTAISEGNTAISEDNIVLNIKSQIDKAASMGIHWDHFVSFFLQIPSYALSEERLIEIIDYAKERMSVSLDFSAVSVRDMDRHINRILAQKRNITVLPVIRYLEELKELNFLRDKECVELKEKLPPAVVASLQGQYQVLDYLKEQGVSLSGATPYLCNNILNAVSDNNVMRVQRSIDHGFKISCDFISGTNEAGDECRDNILTYLLSTSIRNGIYYIFPPYFFLSPEILKCLIRNGLDLNYTNSRGETALSLAIRKGPAFSYAFLDVLGDAISDEDYRQMLDSIMGHDEAVCRKYLSRPYSAEVLFNAVELILLHAKKREFLKNFSFASTNSVIRFVTDLCDLGYFDNPYGCVERLLNFGFPIQLEALELLVAAVLSSQSFRQNGFTQNKPIPERRFNWQKYRDSRSSMTKCLDRLLVEIKKNENYENLNAVGFLSKIFRVLTNYCENERQALSWEDRAETDVFSGFSRTFCGFQVLLSHAISISNTLEDKIAIDRLLTKLFTLNISEDLLEPEVRLKVFSEAEKDPYDFWLFIKFIIDNELSTDLSTFIQELKVLGEESCPEEIKKLYLPDLVSSGTASHTPWQYFRYLILRHKRDLCEKEGVPRFLGSSRKPTKFHSIAKH